MIGEGRTSSPKPLKPGCTVAIEEENTPIFASEGKLILEDERGNLPLEASVVQLDQSSLYIYRPPLPIQPHQGIVLRSDAGEVVKVQWKQAPPDRPPIEVDEDNEDQRYGEAIMNAVLRMANRLDIIKETEKETPIIFWDRMANYWLDKSETPFNPAMDMIVRHAQKLRRFLLDLSQHPRHVLARTHRMTPVARVQEMDRQSILWLSRQPGETWEERAGPGQRILAPVREQGIDTPENRILRSLADESDHIARAWLRGNTETDNRRNDVEHYKQLCSHIARDLKQAAVARAAPGAQPNYVLQHDVRYRQIWTAWRELQQRRRAQDNLWRWQSRTWEEFCLVALTIACYWISNAKLVAAVPILFRTEQSRGKWLIHDEPFAVFWLQQQQLILEIIGKGHELGHPFTQLGASAWIRVSDYSGSCRWRLPIWALHVPSTEAFVTREIDGMMHAVTRSPKNQLIRGGIALRSLIDPNACCKIEKGKDDEERIYLTLDFGPASALIKGIETLEDHLASLIRKNQ